MSKPFTVTEDDIGVAYSVKGFDNSMFHPIVILKEKNKTIYPYLDNSDGYPLDAIKNFHAALGHAIETVEGLESE